MDYICNLEAQNWVMGGDGWAKGQQRGDYYSILGRSKGWQQDAIQEI